MNEGGGEGAQAQWGHVSVRGGAPARGGGLTRWVELARPHPTEEEQLSWRQVSPWRTPYEGGAVAVPRGPWMRARHNPTLTEPNLVWGTGLPWGSLGREERHSPTFRDEVSRPFGESHLSARHSLILCLLRETHSPVLEVPSARIR